ncbi:hypothetical protein OPW32_09565, partial [Vibrio europaeus]|uniref:hypothetical protein n=1 Tax=Vibrio europaeus TaxID=300876 RepID=UPI002341CEAA
MTKPLNRVAFLYLINTVQIENAKGCRESIHLVCSLWKRDTGTDLVLRKTGKLENWKTGKLENWKTGKLENWKTGKLEN